MIIVQHNCNCWIGHIFITRLLQFPLALASYSLCKDCVQTSNGVVYSHSLIPIIMQAEPRGDLEWGLMTTSFPAGWRLVSSNGTIILSWKASLRAQLGMRLLFMLLSLGSVHSPTYSWTSTNNKLSPYHGGHFKSLMNMRTAWWFTPLSGNLLCEITIWMS